MDTWIRNNSTGKYLYVKWNANESGFEENMIRSICGDCLLSSNVSYADDQNCLEFNISGLQSLKEYLERHTISMEKLTSLFLQLWTTVDTIKRYLLSEADLLLDPDRVYIDEEAFRIRLCMVPGSERSFERSLKDLIAVIAMHTDVDDPAALRLGFQLLKTSSEPEFRFHDIMNLIRKSSGAMPGQATGQNRAETLDTTSEIKQENLSGKKYPAHSETAESFFENAQEFPQPEAEYPESAGDEDIYYDEAEPETGSRSVLRSILGSEAILLAAAAVVYLIKGKALMIGLLPVYVVLAACIVLYFAVDHMAAARKQRIA